MNIGIRNDIEREPVGYYESNYDILRTPNFVDKTRLLKPEHGLSYLGNPAHKVCRFCGKSEPEVSFKKVAHAFPESIGNKALATYYECDTCNCFFGKTIEEEYGKFFSLYHSIMMESGKDGKRQCNFKIPCDKRTKDCMKYCVRIGYSGSRSVINACKNVGRDFVELGADSIRISAPVGKCSPIAVYKALVKMAITVMPIEEVEGFSNAIDWILNPKHENFYCKKPLLIKYQMIPGFSVTKYPHYFLYRRKRDVWNVPYMLFNLTYGCFSLLIEVLWDGESKENAGSNAFERLVFPPIPFYTAQSGVWDMSEPEVPKGMKHSVILSFGGMTELDKEEVKMQDGKPVLKRKDEGE